MTFGLNVQDKACGLVVCHFNVRHVDPHNPSKHGSIAQMKTPLIVNDLKESGNVLNRHIVIAVVVEEGRVVNGCVPIRSIGRFVPQEPQGAIECLIANNIGKSQQRRMIDGLLELHHDLGFH